MYFAKNRTWQESGQITSYQKTSQERVILGVVNEQQKAETLHEYQLIWSKNYKF